MGFVRSMCWGGRAREMSVGFAMVFTFFAIEASYARTWNVFVDGSGDAPTVQAGIDSSVAGDTVLVGPGTYPEFVRIVGKDIVLKSSQGPQSTTLDGSGLNQPVVTFDSGVSRAARLEGFTITGGLLGVLIHNSQPSVVDNVITENGPAQEGAGILCSAGTQFPWFPLIQGNTITNNHANNIAGGIGAVQEMVPEILNNYIAGNEARDGDGGGVYYNSFDNGGTIRGNIIENNRAGDHGGGIYVWNHNSIGALEVEVSWNLVGNNYAEGKELTGNSGGGIWLWQTQAWVHHNTIVQNSGGPTSAYGGGIVMERPGTPIVEQNIIAFTLAGGGIWCGAGATPIIQNNLAWQNVGGNGVKDCPNWWQSNGNVVDNPYFCDMANGDFRVASNSGVMTHPAGPLGVYSTPGCGPVAVHHSTWGSLKAKY